MNSSEFEMHVLDCEKCKPHIGHFCEIGERLKAALAFVNSGFFGKKPVSGRGQS